MVAATPLTEHREVGRDEIVRAIALERRKSLELLRSLDEAAWDTPTALSGWRIREVAAHLVATDRASVTGSIVVEVFTSTDRLERWNERKVPAWAGRSTSKLLAGLETWGRRFARVVSLVPRSALRLRLPTAWGRAPMNLMFRIRAYDEWIHRQDIRRAMGLADEQVDLAHIVELLFLAIETSVLPALDPMEGRLWLDLTGVPVPEFGWTLGGPPHVGAASAPRDAPEVRIKAEAGAFVMAVADRDPFELLRAGGQLAVAGDEALAQAFLAKLRIV